MDSRTMHVNRRNARFVFTEIPERAVNKGYWMPECTANFAQGELA